MPIVKNKTWLLSENNSATTNGSNNSDWQGRRRDVADVLGIIINELILLNPTKVSLVSSSDGVSNVNPLNFSNTTNYWVSGSNNFRTNIENHIFGYFNNSVWAILQFPDGQLLFALSRADLYDNYFQVYWTPTTFTIPGAATWRPTSVAEVQLSSWRVSDQNFTQTDNGGIFNHNNLGIINYSSNYTSYTHKVHVLMSDDGKSFYTVSFRDGVPEFIMCFSDLLNPVTNWDSAKIFFMSGTTDLLKQLVGPYDDSNGYQMRSSIDSTVKAIVPAIGNSDSGTNLTNYQNLALNSLTSNGTVDSDTGNYPLFPIAIYSPTYFGVKGSLPDMWWGVSGGNSNTYPSTGSVEYIQANDIVLPWVGTSIPEFT